MCWCRPEIRTPFCGRPGCVSPAVKAANSSWRPIDTAPKDGTPILACRPYESEYNLHPAEHPLTVYWGTYHPNSPGKAGWRDGNGNRRPHVTHWMPLPESPR